MFPSLGKKISISVPWNFEKRNSKWYQLCYVHILYLRLSGCPGSVALSSGYLSSFTIGLYLLSPLDLHRSPVKLPLCMGAHSTLCLPVFSLHPSFPGWFFCLPPHRLPWGPWKIHYVNFLLWIYLNIVTGTYWSYNKYFDKDILFSIEDSSKS